MAIQDAIELASGLCDRYGKEDDGRRLAGYTQTRLPSIWRHQEFSSLMLSLFHRGPTGAEAFTYGLRLARLDLIVNDPRFSRWFADAYVGVDA